MDSKIIQESYEGLFKKATGKNPYPYQIEFATCDELYHYIDIPTGTGKTANIILGWIWKRLYQERNNKEKVPRRLVYCLPMRVIVEQTRDNAIKWLYNLNLISGEVQFDPNDKEKVRKYIPDFSKSEKISVVTLMGGEEVTPWDIYPENDLIIIGTQDMLLSRALNRGYGISRYRWPMQFGLLNNDSLWVFDEIQLMGVGLKTSVQLDSFRDTFGVIKKTESIWMSATIDRNWFKSIDGKTDISKIKILRLCDNDLKNDALSKRINANKIVSKSEYNALNPSSLAEEIIKKHSPKTNTIVILNTVERAKKLFQEIQKLVNKRTEYKEKDILLLLHSQYRPPDRQNILNRLLGKLNDDGYILVTTQVVEAGIDISCKTLYTETAPIQSLIQRFGRCNREGEYESADIFYIGLNDEKGKYYPEPYGLEDIEHASEFLSRIEEKPLQNLFNGINYNIKMDGAIRKKDILELFETSPDLSDYDIDISKYVRNNNDNHVYVFWRDLQADTLQSEEMPRRDELCPAPIKDLRKLQELNSKELLYKWDWINGGWKKITIGERIVHGQIIMIDSKKGHYSKKIGWDIGDKMEVEVLNQSAYISVPRDSCTFPDDPSSQSYWKTISEHSKDVMEKAVVISKSIGFPNSSQELEMHLITAALWHDVGKVHQAFQSKINKAGIPQGYEYDQIAKAPEANWNNQSANSRKYFRHEFASALISLDQGLDNIVVYLVLSHHGKIRTSIRSIAGENIPPDSEKRFAKGVWDGDYIKKVNLPGKEICDITLNLDIVELGETKSGNSWIKRIWDVINDQNVGVFRLAFLESILRASDQRASGGL